MILAQEVRDDFISGHDLWCCLNVAVGVSEDTSWLRAHVFGRELGGTGLVRLPVGLIEELTSLEEL